MAYKSSVVIRMACSCGPAWLSVPAGAHSELKAAIMTSSLVNHAAFAARAECNAAVEFVMFQDAGVTNVRMNMPQ